VGCTHKPRPKAFLALHRHKRERPADAQVFVSGMRRVKGIFKKLLRGRPGIEPVMGHLKLDHRLNRNYLLGQLGDEINAILAGCAFNLKKIMRLSLEQRQLCVV